MIKSEKRSFFRFLAIYLGSTLLLFFLATLIFYHYQKHDIMDRQVDKLQLEAKHFTQELRTLHQQFTPTLPYPNHPEYQSAIYNINKDYIFGTFQPFEILWDSLFYTQGEDLFYLYPIKPYYLGASYLVLSHPINQEPIRELRHRLILFLIIAGLFFTLLGIFLGRLFIQPMRESMEQMNRFIEDTTHELNTPISTILTNIELLETLYSCEGKEERKRIEIASKTLSRLYEDLTYLKLNHNYHREIESLNIGELMVERIEYFQTIIEAKSLQLQKSIEENIIINMDKNDAIRLLDNLISNAIKYNQKSGLLTVKLTNNKLIIYNSGIGIKKENLQKIHQRFSRANQSEGGFGIGLDIVQQVVQRYDFIFKIQSQYKHYTEVTIQW